jgi:hypothetical protein
MGATAAHVRSLARLPRWRWAALAALALVAACGAALVPLQVPAAPSGGEIKAAAAQADTAPRQIHVGPGPEPLTIGTGNDPEGRLIAAYVALGADQGRKAFELVSSLVHDYPEFSLAQLLYGDLLATRAGLPSAFGTDGRIAADDTDPRRQALRLEATRRLAALRERPPQGKLPAEFAQLPAGIRHAVAVDASRSRLYLFVNGPQGLMLERDFYVSIGKQGFAKQVEGDRRTPLGVYWITAALPRTQLDERFGNAALRFNYPNALDRIRGRTGTGLYLHGVPPSVLAHVPWSTDGCVAMANEDVGHLLQKLDVDSTPVVISKALKWVAPTDVQQAAAEFRPAFEAWDNARRHADAKDLAIWYDAKATVPAETLRDSGDRADVSFVAWYGDDAPVMVVTAYQRTADTGTPAAFRQYWIQQDGQWKVLFDGPVSVSDTPPSRALSVASTSPARKSSKSQREARREAKRETKRAQQQALAARRAVQVSFNEQDRRP